MRKIFYLSGSLDMEVCLILTWNTRRQMADKVFIIILLSKAALGLNGFTWESFGMIE